MLPVELSWEDDGLTEVALEVDANGPDTVEKDKVSFLHYWYSKSITTLPPWCWEVCPDADAAGEATAVADWVGNAGELEEEGWCWGVCPDAAGAVEVLGGGSTVADWVDRAWEIDEEGKENAVPVFDSPGIEAGETASKNRNGYISF